MFEISIVYIGIKVILKINKDWKSFVKDIQITDPIGFIKEVPA